MRDAGSRIAAVLGLAVLLAPASCRRELSTEERARMVDWQEKVARAEARAAAAEARAQASEAALRATQEQENHECGRVRAELQLLKAQLARDGGAPAAPRGARRCAQGDPLCQD